jgi:hypothetical protein
MTIHCSYCGATPGDTSGCRHCDPTRKTSHFAKSEVSFGPFGRTVLTLIYAGVVAGAFYLIHHNLTARPLAWWVLVAFGGLFGVVMLRGIWKPVRHHPRHH